MKNVFSVFKQAFSYRYRAMMIIVFHVLNAIFELFTLVLFIPFLGIIFKPEKLENLHPVEPTWDFNSLPTYISKYYNYYQETYIVEHGPMGALVFICILVLIAFFLKNICRYIVIYHQSYMRMAVVRDIRKSLFSKAIHLPLSFFTEEKKGDLMSRMVADVGEIEISVVDTLQVLFREPIKILITLTFLFAVSVELTLFSLILLPLSASILAIIKKSLKRTSVQGQDKLGEVMSIIEEAFGGVRIIKAFNAYDQVEEKFNKDNDEHKRLLTKVFRKRELASPLNEVLGSLVLISIAYFGGNLILKGESSLTGEDFLGFIIVFSQLMRPIQGIATSVANLAKGSAAIERINKILLADEKIRDPENPKEVSEVKESIRFNNVSFGYADIPVLQNINFEIKRGQTIALVGESGSGKTTLADLVPRFYDVNDGSITIDGVDIRENKVKELREIIGIVSQEAILFNDSVKNNISFGMPNATDEQIMEAAKIANAHDFIMSLEEGYNTNIGERGNKLSGGQKQRLSIARAVLKNPPILILDEATSALDTESEKVVQDALNKLMENRTSIVIAHRLSTIKHADTIYVINKGEIVESGDHDTLISKRGYYYNLCNIQSLL
ncbi:MAG: ABC transporter ATP-binding protein [Crocinitomicaceae bacterium]|nr:ABC transporter ATP-binding protein [Crocinitomicaceae bacterium]